MANLKRGEARERLLAAAAVWGDVDEACRRVGVSVSHLEELRVEDAVWSARLDAVAAFDPRVCSPEPFDVFRLRCFGHESPAHHLRMMRALEAAEPESLTVLLAFPDAGKTSLLIDWFCWRLAFDPDYRIAVISEGQDLARKIVGLVARRMSDELVAPEFLRSFGPFRSEDRSRGWNADWLQVLRSRGTEKDPSLEARGAGSALYGGRYDKVVPDDVQSDRNLSATPTLLRYIRQTVLTRPAEESGSTAFVGSRVGVGDVYHRMHEEGMVDHLVTIPALSEHVSQEEHYSRRKVDGKFVVEVNPDCKAKSAWPERWSLLRLAQRRHKVGEEVWARTYMQKSVSESSSAFPEAVVERAKDLGRTLGRGSVGSEVVCAIDPGLDSGTCAFLAAALSPDKLWLLDAAALRGLGTTEEILERVDGWSRRLRPSRWIVEKNAFQRALARDERFQALARKYGFDIVEHNTGRNKQDPLMGMRQMGTAFADEEISIPYGDEDARQVMSQLCSQLVEWVPTKRGTELVQDLAISLWFIWISWEAERHGVKGPLPKLWTPSWMSGRRTA